MKHSLASIPGVDAFTALPIIPSYTLRLWLIPGTAM